MSETGHFSTMKKLWDLKNVFSNLELEGQGIIMGVTSLLLLGPFYSIQTNFLYFFAHNCTSTVLRFSQRSICLFFCSIILSHMLMISFVFIDQVMLHALVVRLRITQNLVITMDFGAANPQRKNVSVVRIILMIQSVMARY